MRNKHLVCLALLLSACGDDSNELGESGVASTKVVAGLSQGDQRKLCRWASAQRYELPVQSECEGDATLSWSTQAECESARDECIASAPADRAEQMQYGLDNCENEVSPRRNCKLTVAEVETCIRDQVANERAFYGALTCDRVAEDIGDNVPDPPSCERLDLSCDF